MTKNIQKFILSSVLLLSNAIAFGQAKIQFDALEYTMNPVKRNESAALKIPFYNTGNQDLIITRTRGTGAPTVYASNEPIPPNGKGFIEFKMPTNFVGTTKQHIYINTNIDDKEIVLIINLKVIEEIKTQSENSFTLPEIKKLNYISIPSNLKRIFPPNSCQDSLINLMKNYNKRLENINEYQVYFVKHSCEFSQNTCLCFKTTAQGEFNFLILFNPKTKQANVVLSSYEFLSDSEVYSMHFKIKNNEILLTDSGITEGENGEGEDFSKNTIKIKVLKNGKIKVISGKK